MSEKDAKRIEEAAENLNKAMSGIGTDEDRIIIQLAKFNNAERQQIKAKYLALYGKKLDEDITKELSGHFQAATLAYIIPKDELDSHFIHREAQQPGTNEKLFIQTVCTKDATEMKALSETYKKLYSKNIDEEIKSEIGGDLRKILRALLSCQRAENHGFDPSDVKKEAEELYDAGKGKIGTDEHVFIRLLSSRSFPQLYSTFSVYMDEYRVDIEESIKKEMSGDLCDALLAIAKSVRNRPAYFAEQIKEAIKEKSGKEEILMRLIIGRAEIDLEQIKEEYNRLYNQTLYEAIKADLEGDLKNLFLEIINQEKKIKEDKAS